MRKRRYLIAVISAVAVFALFVILLIAFGSSGEKSEIYYIASIKSTDLNAVNAASARAKFKGGAGYVYSENENKYVFLMAYFDKDSAKEVLSNLSGSNYFIYTKTFDESNINCKLYKLNEEYYSLIVKYDGKTLKTAAARAEFVALNKKFSEIVRETRYVKGKNQKDYLNALKYAEEAETSDDASLSYEIKYVFVSLTLLL